jgi:hypothetical protein
MSLTKRIIHLDSRDVVSHRNKNPSKITYNLRETLPDVIQVKLMAYSFPYSPTFIIIRVSDDEPAGTALVDLDEIHQRAVWLEAKLRQFESIEVSNVVATIYNADSSVALGVTECFTFINDSEDGTTFKTYDIFVCTGSVTTTSRTGWQLSIAEIGTITDLTAPGDNASVSMAVNYERIYAHMHIGGQAHGRIHSTRSTYPTWSSFQVYRRRDLTFYNGTNYECMQNHMSLIFARDYEERAYWQPVNLLGEFTTTAADSAFFVLEPTAENTEVITASVAEQDITVSLPRYDLSTFDIEFFNRDERHYIFPHTASIEFLSFSGTGTEAALLHKDYQPFTFTLEFTYIKPTS